MTNHPQPTEIQIGIVGLGLMGCSISTCLLIAGHKVTAFDPIQTNISAGEKRIHDHFQTAREKGLLDKHPDDYLENLVLADAYEDLKSCQLIIESVKEDESIKAEVFKAIDAVVSPEALITTNTSAIPISKLQEYVSHPERFYGLHWMEPAHTTRFLEVICGDRSDMKGAEYLYSLAVFWQKEAVLVKKDIRGFVANRLMYAMYREALYLVEGDYASVEDVDRACRNVAGFFIPMMGVFRWMDFTGIGSYREVMKELFPTLSNATQPNELINRIVDNGGNGIFNGKGFYEYTEEERKIWLETYTRFSYEIRELALKYPADLVQQQLASGEKE
ncbi:3-hydroxyacyl-CoA dehydrogenase family protein [Negadavirga shengliensis]|uniref:3-hydroxyacyl-CoA dehydrogenase family protein n=1 Tax=Negadavirga shengliensis TaxID=1389218 RepID=A0ABV9SZM8_9BACT